jgi:hypothetical protein
MNRHHPLFFAAAPASFAAVPSGVAPGQSVELVLNSAEGEPWTLRMSPGIEQFVGWYPRLGGIDPGGPLMVFREACADDERSPARETGGSGSQPRREGPVRRMMGGLRRRFSS